MTKRPYLAPLAAFLCLTVSASAAGLPGFLRVASFTLSPAQARELTHVLETRWAPVLVGDATLQVRITADPGLDRGMAAYAASDLPFDLIEAHAVPYLERWPNPADSPLRPFLEWSPTSRAWPAARRTGLLVVRHGYQPDAHFWQAGRLAMVGRQSWLGGKVQLRMLDREEHPIPSGRWLECGDADDVLRAVKIGWADVGALPGDPHFSWGLAYDLAAQFSVLQSSDPQPPPVWFISRRWAEAHPAGLAWLREVLREYFGPDQLLPISTLGRDSRAAAVRYRGAAAK